MPSSSSPRLASMAMPSRVRIYEVGPRDGLQNEATPIPTAAKLEYIRLLAAAGLREIEATSFVSPRAIPQLADADALLPALLAGSPPGVRYPVLVPNERGFDRAQAAGADALAVFTAASDAFTQANIGMSVAESLDAFAPVLRRGRDAGWWTRAYVSTAFGCPFSGAVEPARVVEVALALRDLGAEEVCVGDTIGVGGPSDSSQCLDCRMVDFRGAGSKEVSGDPEQGVRARGRCVIASSRHEHHLDRSVVRAHGSKDLQKPLSRVRLPRGVTG